MVASALLVSMLVGDVPKVDASNLQRWLEYLAPARQEVQYEELPWRPTFWEAVTEAARTDKPILLWAMNGHPLGCT